MNFCSIKLLATKALSAQELKEQAKERRKRLRALGRERTQLVVSLDELEVKTIAHTHTQTKEKKKEEKKLPTIKIKTIINKTLQIFRKLTKVVLKPKKNLNNLKHNILMFTKLLKQLLTCKVNLRQKF